MKKIFAAIMISTFAGSSSAAASKPAETARRPEMVVQMGHTANVNAIAITPNGKYLITASEDDTAKLWNISTGIEIRTFKGHAEAIESAAISPDGRYLITGSDDNSAKLWDIGTGKEIRAFKGHTFWVKSVAFTPDGKFIVTGSADKTARLWNMSTGECVRTFRGHAGIISAIAISPNGKFLATASEDRTAKLWSLSTGRLLMTYAGHKSELIAIAISPDGNYLATGSMDSTARIWNLSTGAQLKTFQSMENLDWVKSVVFSPDGKYLGTGSTAAKLWDLSTSEVIRTFNTDQGFVDSVAISPDGKFFAAAGPNKTRLWDISTGDAVQVFSGHTASVESLAVSPDGNSVAVVSEDKTTRLWDLAAGQQVKTFHDDHGSPDCIAFTPDRKSLAICSDSHGGTPGAVKLWDISSGTEIRTYDSRQLDVSAIAISPDGRSLFATSIDNIAKQWDMATANEVRTFRGRPDSRYGMTSAAVSPDGQLLVIGNDDKTADLWNIETGEDIRTYKGHSQAVNAVAISPDGKYLATGSVDDTAKLWNLSTGKELKTFRAPGADVLSVAFSPDGKLLATGNIDHTAKLWSMSTGQSVLTFKGHAGMVNKVAMTPDGKRLISTSSDGTTRLWDSGSGQELCRLISSDIGWVVVTPEGFFDGSPEGMKSIRWTVGMESFPLEAFSEGYYVPGLLARVMSGEKISGAKSLAKGFALPPAVKITMPANGATVESESIELRVQATDQGGGVGEIRLYQNGKALGDEARGMKVVPSGTVNTQTFHVTLVDGKNVFRAVALSRDRIESNPDEITVTLKGPEKQATLEVVAVGINKYKNGALDLNYARPDAQAISDFFASAPRDLFRAVNRHELFDADATKAGILGVLAGLKTAAPQDVVVIYLAGHGESIGNTWYFVPYDLVYPEHEEQLKAKALSSTELVAAVGNIRAQKVLILLDACKSGEALLAFAGRGLEDRKALLQLARSAGVHVMAASTKDQIAAEVKELGHGVFTYTLLKGLKGEADTSPKDGTVTVSELLTYVENELPAVSEKYKAEAQYPVRDERGMDFPISTVK